MRLAVFPLVALLAASLTVMAAPPETTSTFDQAVRPILVDTCRACHNPHVASGDLDLSAFSDPGSIEKYREGWERIVQKVSAGEMPPRGAARPPRERIDTFVAFVEGAFDRADRRMPFDPGRVTARRLNRNEYSNTIRDLLGVSFHAETDFPSDDSGYGFDNIGDVLSVSPLLMEKYLAAAERIAAAAIGADPLPGKPLEAAYRGRDKTILRLDPGTIEATHRVEWRGEYVVRIILPGERRPDSPPVTMNFRMDGELLHSMQVETKPSELVYFLPRSIEQMRLYLPAGDHVFQAGFINDDFVETLCEEDVYSRKKNKFPDSIIFTGPFPAEDPGRGAVLVCDPKSGEQCVRQIVARLARRAYRRPVTEQEIGALAGFVEQARREGRSVEQGLQLAIQAMLVSPHFLFRIERDPNPVDPAGVHRVSDIELASRLSYFLWSSMPDDELLGLAEAGRLSDPAVLDAQLTRMLADEKSAALAANFGGQWLQTRNLGGVTPDPDKFPTWNAGLREAMKTETRLFFEAMLRENRPMSDFLDARFTFLNERLAKHYGISGIRGPEFRRVELDTDQRGGVLAQAAVLTVTSYPTRTSPVLRGKYVLEAILGTPPPPPPADVPVLDETKVGSSGTLRQQLEQHRANPACAVCHDRMDALGFGLENYDAIGRWRKYDGDFPIDSGGTLPNGKSFSGPAEMKQILKLDLRAFARAVTEKMLIYGLGRGLESYDRRALAEITGKLDAAGYPFQSLVHEVVRSLPFQMRRGEDATQVGHRPTEVAGQ